MQGANNQSSETVLAMEEAQRNDILISQLLFSASRGDLEGCRSLIGQGIDPSGADYDGRSALHVAASKGHAAVVEYLISVGAKVNAVDRFNGKPRDDAVRYGHNEISEILIKAGADKPSSQFEMDLINASFNGDLDVARKLLGTKVDPNCKDYDGRTPLHLAAAQRHVEITKVLLESGADPRAVDRFGGTPLDDAIRNKKRMGRDEIVDIIKSHCESLELDEKVDAKKSGSGVFAVISSQPIVPIIAIFQIVMVIFHGFFAKYSLDTSLNGLYPIFQDVHGMSDFCEFTICG